MIITLIVPVFASSINEEGILLVKLSAQENNKSETMPWAVSFKNEDTKEIFSFLADAGVIKMKLPAGIYRLLRYTTFGKIRKNMYKHGYVFRIRPDHINYVGDWLFVEDWSEFMSENGKLPIAFTTTFTKKTVKTAFEKYPNLFKQYNFSVSQAIPLKGISNDNGTG